MTSNPQPSVTIRGNPRRTVPISVPDYLAHLALHRGDLRVDIDEGAIYRRDGSRAEYPERTTGYGRVILQPGRSPATGMAHRIVWIAAHGLIPAGLVVNHRNHRRWDNRIANLELVTPAGNARHRASLGYDAIGGNVDLEWLGRLDHGEPAEPGDDETQAAMQGPPGTMHRPTASGRGAVTSWDQFV